MSTKVDTGFRLVTEQRYTIIAMMEAAKSGIEQLQRRRYLAAYASILVSMLDRTQLAREAGHSRGMVIAMPGSLVREAIFRRQARARAAGERDPAVDIGVVLRCWHSQLLDRVIGYVAGAFGQEILGLLKDAGIATGYAFWTSGARDDTVSPQEWSQRRAAWHQALNGQSGERIEFCYDAESMDLLCPWCELEPYVPSLESRARELAEPALFSRWYESLPPKGDDGEHLEAPHAVQGPSDRRPRDAGRARRGYRAAQAKTADGRRTGCGAPSRAAGAATDRLRVNRRLRKRPGYFPGSRPLALVAGSLLRERLRPPHGKSAPTPTRAMMATISPPSTLLEL